MPAIRRLERHRDASVAEGQDGGVCAATRSQVTNI